MTNKELQEELKKYPDDMAILMIDPYVSASELLYDWLDFDFEQHTCIDNDKLYIG